MLASGRRRILFVQKVPSVRLQRRPQIHANRWFSTTEPPRTKVRLPFFVYGLLATGGTAGAYLFWPDASRSAPTYTNALLSPTHFTPVTLTSSEPCPDSSTRLITLTVPSQSLPSPDETMFGPIWSVFIKDDDIQVERPYTPLEGIDSDGRMKFWIKKYPKGEVGRWLHSKSVGESIEIRGPLKTWPWQDDLWDQVIMISGGTGITPFYQLLHHTILKNPSSESKMRFVLLHSSCRPAELPPAELLDPLMSKSEKNLKNLTVTLFVDSLDGPEHPSVASSVLRVGKINQAAIERAVRPDGSGDSWWRSILHRHRHGHKDAQQKADKKTLILICGPDPMITAIAGPFGRNFSQGEVGGVLGAMGYEREQVWKL